MALQDVYNKVDSAAAATGAKITEVKKLVDDIQGATGEELQKLQAKLQQAQQDLEMRKQIEEKLLKITELINKFPQV